ncbi:hypothetical protein HN358_04060 [Candidatus Uhrbacteria bacterium]|jgi:hypothetical protein|nr:hypothetical protein [Candidatus Uhrbacteria bacterium]MBT7716953.1 hypothetical protein [Candidatus Uhrbacteria bacterium]
MKLIREDSDGQKYQADGFKLYYRNKGSISGDNENNPYEKVYLITGEAKVTIKNLDSIVQSPTYFEIPANTYHKIEAITEISFIIFD